MPRSNDVERNQQPKTDEEKKKEKGSFNEVRNAVVSLAFGITAVALANNRECPAEPLANQFDRGMKNKIDYDCVRMTKCVYIHIRMSFVL